MTECQVCQTLLPDVLYGQLNEDKRNSFESHLGQCEECRREYAQLLACRTELEKRERPEPNPAFWEGYWDRLENRMHREKVLYHEAGSKSPRFNWFRFRLPRWAFQAAGAAFLVVVGIVIGRVVLAPSAPGVPSTTTAQTQISNDMALELASRTESYVTRSNLVLMAIVNFDADSEDPYVLDLPHKQEMSRALVQEAAWLKQGLDSAHERRLQELVSDLEAVLLQIANLEADGEVSAIELVQTGVQGRGIFLKMHLAEVNRPWEQLLPQAQSPAGSKPSKIF